MIDGLRVIRSGIAPTDRVVIVGTQFAVPGSQGRNSTGQDRALKSSAATPTVSAPLSGKATFAN